MNAHFYRKIFFRSIAPAISGSWAECQDLSDTFFSSLSIPEIQELEEMLLDCKCRGINKIVLD